MNDTNHTGYTGYTALDVTRTDGVLTVSLNHPPLNLLDRVLIPSRRLRKCGA
jgi:hypothetical protein